MKEGIISLLEAGMRIEVEFKGEMPKIIVAHKNGLRVVFDGVTYGLCMAEISKIVSVLPPNKHEYKKGDNIMRMEDEWGGPFEVKRIPQTTVLYIEWYKGFAFGYYAYIKDITICPYHKGVNYNALPVSQKDESNGA